MRPGKITERNFGRSNKAGAGPKRSLRRDDQTLVSLGQFGLGQAVVQMKALVAGGVGVRGLQALQGCNQKIDFPQKIFLADAGILGKYLG
jgi:hypothetical protein